MRKKERKERLNEMTLKKSTNIVFGSLLALFLCNSQDNSILSTPHGIRFTNGTFLELRTS